MLTVKQRSWDCPSCGHDKRKRLADICMIAKPDTMITLTFKPPVAVSVDALEDLRRLDPGYLRAPAYECFAALERYGEDAGEVLVQTPAEFVGCRRVDHLVEFPDRFGRRSIRWVTRSTCAQCCRRVSRELELWIKRLRRVWPEAQYLQAREDHKSGAMHIHLAMRGLPPLTRRNEAGLFVKAQWVAVGGGPNTDLGDRRGNEGGARQMGWYLGKYLAKRHDQRMARGYRRWSRSADFAGDVRMTEPYIPPDLCDQDGVVIDQVPVTVLGWAHPDTGELVHLRVWEPG